MGQAILKGCSINVRGHDMITVVPKKKKVLLCIFVLFVLDFSQVFACFVKYWPVLPLCVLGCLFAGSEKQLIDICHPK